MVRSESTTRGALQETRKLLGRLPYPVYRSQLFAKFFRNSSAHIQLASPPATMPNTAGPRSSLKPLARLDPVLAEPTESRPTIHNFEHSEVNSWGHRSSPFNQVLRIVVETRVDDDRSLSVKPPWLGYHNGSHRRRSLPEQVRGVRRPSIGSVILSWHNCSADWYSKSPPQGLC